MAGDQDQLKGPHRIGELLVRDGKLDPRKLDRALRLQGETNERLGVLLAQFGDVAERDVVRALSNQLGISVAESDDYLNAPSLNGRISVEFMQRVHCVPLSVNDAEVMVAMADPGDQFVLEAIELATGLNVVPRIGTRTDIAAALRRIYGVDTEFAVHDSTGNDAAAVDHEDIEALRDQASEAPVIRIVNRILAQALTKAASDVHIEPFDGRLMVRFRIDGVLREQDLAPAGLGAALTSRIKVMAKLDIAERRLPQDGRIRLPIDGQEVDMRVSTVPTLHGESVVIRLLDKSQLHLDFGSLGFDDDLEASFRRIVDLPHGIVLVSGPTGSGKTTTLYTALECLNNTERKILTVEDPVEYQLQGINQIPVRPQIGLDFATALRSILRQDPDVIMIGEMRDLETATIGVQSALTGHKVFSTLHTNDAASSVVRLLDMGVESFLLTSTLSAVLSQRLVRRLCPSCAQPYQLNRSALPDSAALPAAEQLTFHRPSGCSGCDQRGYRGRTGLFELLIIDDDVRAAILRRADAGEIMAVAVAAGTVSMYQHGLHQALAGTTSLEEVLRVVHNG